VGFSHRFQYFGVLDFNALRSFEIDEFIGIVFNEVVELLISFDMLLVFLDKLLELIKTEIFNSFLSNSCVVESQLFFPQKLDQGHHPLLVDLSFFEIRLPHLLQLFWGELFVQFVLFATHSYNI
jgi:hypothetical protein